MNTGEDRNTKQVHFCFLCGGAGTSRYDDIRRVCAKCMKLLKTWNLPRKQPIHHPKQKLTPEEKEQYKVKRVEFLERNDICLVALFVFGRFEKSSVVHHSKGRGKYYLAEETWIATTRAGDRWIHEHAELAKELGFL